MNLSPLLPHQRGESPAGFVARLAALHGFCAREFCRDMGLHFQGIVDGYLDALTKLAEVASVSLQRLRQEAIVKLGRNRHVVAGEQIVRATLMRSRIRICPECLIDDIDNAEVPARAAAYDRTLWNLAPLRTCSVHRLSLIEIAHADSPELLHDFALNIASHIDTLPELAKTCLRRPPSGLETYLLDRLEGRRGMHPWLDALQWHVAAEACTIVGAVSLFGRNVKIKVMTETDAHAAGAEGFRLMADGTAGLTSLLTDLEATSPKTASSNEGPQAIFGSLFKWLYFKRLPEFEPLKTFVSEYIIAHRPVGPGDTLLGKPVEYRRIHSVRSASLETGLHPKRLRTILLAVGILDPKSNELTDEHAIFDAELAAPMLAQALDAMPLKEVAEYLNSGRVHTKLLYEAGIISPFVQKSGELNFAKCEIDAFMQKLMARALPVDDQLEDVFDIPDAARRANCGAMEIVNAILDGSLKWVGRLKNERGYMAVLVKVTEVKALTRGKPLPGLPLWEVERELGTSHPVVVALIDHGILPTITAVNPSNRCPTRVVPFAALEEFQDTFISLFNLAAERDEHFLQVRDELNAHGIAPELPSEIFQAAFYRRSDIPGF